MSLWWVAREQLDRDQLSLIENLSLQGDNLVLGPPGSGKTNVLLRRAQFVRTQGLPNIVVLTFTRSLTEFIKTGCYDEAGREIFPQNCISTLEAWIRNLYSSHGEELPALPAAQNDLETWKRDLAQGALRFVEQERVPMYDAIFVDEAQDLMIGEVQLLRQWGARLFFVGDDRQKIYDYSDGLTAIREIVAPANHTLRFHYRLGPEICAMADRILRTQASGSLASTSHYSGPSPSTVNARGPLTRSEQLAMCAQSLRDQIRVYGDLIRQGDRLGVIVARTQDRDAVLEFFEADPDLKGKAKIIRARAEGETKYDPSFASEYPVCIVTVQGCKGLEFRAIHWLFCDELSYRHRAEHYYTVVTRAKTSLDLSFDSGLPPLLSRAYDPPAGPLW